MRDAEDKTAVAETGVDHKVRTLQTRQRHLVRTLATGIRAAGVAVVLAATLAGCTGAPPPPFPIGDVLGEPLTETLDIVSDDAALFIQDVSPRVDLPASYREGSDPAAWTVVAVCADADDLRAAVSVEVAVVPEGSLDDGDGPADRFDEAVGCAGRAHGAQL